MVIIMKKVLDGNSAASLMAYKFSELASIYPITPSSPMADNLDKYNSLGDKNLFGNGVKVIETPFVIRKPIFTLTRATCHCIILRVRQN